MDLTHIIRDADEEPVNTDNMEEWKENSASISARELLERMNPLDGKARRRIRRAQERKHKKK